MRKREKGSLNVRPTGAITFFPKWCVVISVSHQPEFFFMFEAFVGILQFFERVFFFVFFLLDAYVLSPVTLPRVYGKQTFVWPCRVNLRNSGIVWWFSPGQQVISCLFRFFGLRSYPETIYLEDSSRRVTYRTSSFIEW